jgi:hypothetical protein
LFDAKNQTMREISIAPMSLASPDWQEFPIPELDNAVIDPNMRAPDGYEFHKRSSSGGDVMPFFFSYGGRNTVSIGKDGREFRISPQDSRYDYYDGVNFLGWIMKDANGSN